MMGPLSFLARLERAADAFLADPRAMRPGMVGVLRKTTQRVEHRLSESERDHLADQALSLMDPDVRGWVIVTIREHRGSCDLDADIHIPAGMGVGVEAILWEALST